MVVDTDGAAAAKVANSSVHKLSFQRRPLFIFLYSLSSIINWKMSSHSSGPSRNRREVRACATFASVKLVISPEA